jgi:hypothetical protein
MMSKNISEVKCKLIGISCLEGEVRRAAKQEWDARFYEHESFWVDVQEDNDTRTIAQTIAGMFRDRDITTMGNQSVILAMFLDMTIGLNEQLLAELLQLPNLVSRVLSCTVSISLEFGYTAEPAFGDCEALKENIRRVVALNCQDSGRRKQLCLVGISPLWDEAQNVCWKSVMVCLDILRRDSSPAMLIPAEGNDFCDNIGFLRYGEYDEKKLNSLNEKQTEIEKALDDGGAVEMRNLLSVELGKIEIEVENRYQIDGNCQPIHPNMSVEGFFARRAARRGGEPFASARNSTWRAVDLTGKRLQEMIQNDYREKIENAPTILRRYLEAANVGIDLEMDKRRMGDILSVEPIGVSEPMTPALDYKETGYAAEIDNYLKSIRRFTGAKMRHDFAKALLNAYREIPDSVYEARKLALQQNLASVKGKISRQMTKKQLLDLMAQGGELPGKAFRITQGTGRSIYWVLYRSPKDSEEVERAISGTIVSGCYIDSNYGGLKSLDNAPVKGLQMLQFKCTEECLSDVIG